MGDIFDEVEGQQGGQGDIFDQIAPENKRTGRLGVTQVQGDVESPNFGRMAMQALASGPSSIGKEVAPAANYYGNEVPSGAFRGMVSGRGYAQGAMHPEQMPMIQPQLIDLANRGMDAMGVNKLPNQNILPKWMGSQFNPQVMARQIGGFIPSAVGLAADQASRPADMIAMMASGLPAGEALVGGARSMPALEGYGEMMNVAPQLKKMNLGDRMMQMLPFLQQRFGKGNNMEQAAGNVRAQAPLADEAYKTTSEVIPVNEKIGGYELKQRGEKFPEATRVAAGEISPSKDYSQLTQQMQGKNKDLWKTIVQRLTGKQNLDKARFVKDTKNAIAQFRFREMGRAGYSPSDEATIKRVLERFFKGVLEQERKTGKYDMLDALMDKRVENELTSRLRKMEATGQNLGSISAEKIAHEAIREALLKQVTEADPVAGQMARKWGQIDEATTTTSGLAQRENNTVKGGINPVEVATNPKGSAVKALTDKLMHRDLNAKTTKIAENMRKIKQLQEETKSLLGKSQFSENFGKYGNPPQGGTMEKMPPFTNRPSPDKPNFTMQKPDLRTQALKQPRGLEQGSAPKQIEQTMESRPAPRQLEHQSFDMLTGDAKREAIIKSRAAKMNRKKAGNTLIGQRELEKQAAQKKSLGAANPEELGSSPAVMAPPEEISGRGLPSSEKTEWSPMTEAGVGEPKVRKLKTKNVQYTNERGESVNLQKTGFGKVLKPAYKDAQGVYETGSWHDASKIQDPTFWERNEPNNWQNVKDGFVDKNAGEFLERDQASLRARNYGSAENVPSKGIAPKSSEAPLSESKTIREGNPTVTDVGEKSVGAMEIKNLEIERKPIREFVKSQTGVDIDNADSIGKGGFSPTNTIAELNNNPEFQKKNVFEKIRIASEVERKPYENRYSGKDAIKQNLKQDAADVAGVDTVRGCQNNCVSCYANKLSCQTRIGHTVPVAAEITGKIPKGKVLRVGITGDPATDWEHSIKQIQDVIARSEGASEKSVVVVSKLQNLVGFKPEVIKNMQVSIDPLDPKQMKITMENLLRIKDASPDSNIVLRIRSFASKNKELQNSLKEAVDFANKNKFPVLETKMRFTKEIAKILDADMSKYHDAGSVVKANEGFLKKQVKRYLECDPRLKGCKFCGNCSRTAKAEYDFGVPKK